MHQSKPKVVDISNVCFCMYIDHEMNVKCLTMCQCHSDWACNCQCHFGVLYESGYCDYNELATESLLFAFMW